MVQREIQKRERGKKYHSGAHTFSAKIKCGYCGSWYGSKVWHSTSKYRKIIWQCNHKFQNDEHCNTPHLTDEEIQQVFLTVANSMLTTKATVIADAKEMMELLFDTTALEQEQDELLHETQLVSDMVQQCIQENARIALDQTDYQKRYSTTLTDRFEKAKTRLETVMDELQQLQTKRAEIDAFLKAFEQLSDALTEFSQESWHSLVDFATVYGVDDIRFTFKNGQKIRT